jgi:hypothetical protein
LSTAGMQFLGKGFGVVHNNRTGFLMSGHQAGLPFGELQGNLIKTDSPK